MNSTESSLLNYPIRLSGFTQNAVRFARRVYHHFAPASLSQLLRQVKKASTATQLRSSANRVQKALWKLPVKEQVVHRSKLINILSIHVLHSPDTALRLEAASWLRALVQAGLVTQPAEVFVTLVTAATEVASTEDNASLNEQRAYLKLIFDCFWPFRYPYPAFTWQAFPANEVFYPLAPLLSKPGSSMQEVLIAIFAELSTLDDPEISEHLLPIAIGWAKDPDPERRRLITNILALMSDTRAQEALRTLQDDVNQEVRNSAKRAAEYVQTA